MRMPLQAGLVRVHYAVALMGGFDGSAPRMVLGQMLRMLFLVGSLCLRRLGGG